MTSHRIGVNLRVSGNCDQGARKYMEDNHIIKFLKKDTDDYEFAYFGIFDGHGGPEASAFCKDNLLNEITKYEGFWTDDDEQVLAAVKKGFLDTHDAMWSVLDSWPKTVTGLPSTAGSTATIAIIKQGKLYTGHVGDSALVLGENIAYLEDETAFQAVCITKEHKPDDPDERLRIEDAGGEVINKSGVPRVVWSRPKTSHKGPVRRSTQIDQIPFLAVARSLGDLWSYDYYTETYVVSPEPDVAVMTLDPRKHRCLILASDGLWNMLAPEETVNVVMDLESQFEQKIISDPTVSVSFWSNPAECLVSRALNKWRSKSLKADNTSCVVVLIDPLGPSKLTLLRQKRQTLLSGGEITTTQLNKLPKLSIETEHRNRARNKNANCNSHEFHIRAGDDSVYQLAADSKHIDLSSYVHTTYDDKQDQQKSPADSSMECLKDCGQTILTPTLKWSLRHSLDYVFTNTNSLKNPSGYSKKISLHPNKSGFVCKNKLFNRKYETVFTKLVSGNAVAEVDSKRKIKLNEKMVHLNNQHLIEDLHDDYVKYSEDEIEIEKSDGECDSDFEKSLPEPLIFSDAKKAISEESREVNLLHRPSYIVNKTFTKASNESLKSHLSSFSSAPCAPQNAAFILSSCRSRRRNGSRQQYSRDKKKFQTPTRLGLNLPFHVADHTSLVNKAAHATFKSSRAAASSDQDNINQIEINELADTVAQTAKKDINVKSKTVYNNVVTSVEHSSLQKQVLNTSKSLIDITSPCTQKNKIRSVSFTGSTTDTNNQVSKISTDVNNQMSELHTDTKDQMPKLHTDMYNPLLKLHINNNHQSSEVPKNHQSSKVPKNHQSSKVPKNHQSLKVPKNTPIIFVSDTESAVMKNNPLSLLKAANMAEAKAAFTTELLNETGMLLDDKHLAGVLNEDKKLAGVLVDDKKILNQSSALTLTRPLKQSNKTGPVRKVASRRWEKMQRISKEGIDQIFHHKVAEKSFKTPAGDTSVIIKDVNTLSDYKFNDTIIAKHLEDVAVSQLADLTVNASLDNVTKTSTLFKDGDIFTEQTGTHKKNTTSKTLPRKMNKHHTRFFQKTKRTLRQASKIAKKALFPENNKFHKAEKRKRSAECISVPQMKRQKQLETNRT